MPMAGQSQTGIPDSRLAQTVKRGRGRGRECDLEIGNVELVVGGEVVGASCGRH